MKLRVTSVVLPVWTELRHWQRTKVRCKAKTRAGLHSGEKPVPTPTSVCSLLTPPAPGHTLQVE